MQELTPPDLVPSSLTNIAQHQVQTAQVLAPELTQPIVRPTLHYQDHLLLQHCQGPIPLQTGIFSCIVCPETALATRSSLLSNSRMPEESLT